MSLLIQHIKSLVQVRETVKGPLKGKDLGVLPAIEHAYLLIEGDRIAAFGPMSESPGRAGKVIDATDRMVFPSWVDSHTHLVFAASREAEFVDRINGLSYAEIAQRGGGILNSARRLQETPEAVLLEQAWARLQEVIGFGTGAIEIKSGYGLTSESELKMLRVIRKLGEMAPIPVKATFLGAHAMPLKYRENRSEYLRQITQEMLPQIAGEGLADYIDVFCEKNFYSVEETERILEAGARYGLKAKIHTNQFHSMGGIQAAIRYNALSVDHLEVVNETEIAALRKSKTLPVLLPTAPFFLNNEHRPPARKLIDAGLPVALATDFNPGTTPSGRMSFVLSLACIQLRMTPEEAVNAATVNGAFALEMGDACGAIAKGYLANVFITKPMPSVAYLPYAFGSDLVERVVLNGQVH